ncbi:MAG: NINE protein [Burkholderiaceae bacterium]|nr:NINE protein [Burkholderiaceae bacterium]
MTNRTRHDRQSPTPTEQTIGYAALDLRLHGRAPLLLRRSQLTGTMWFFTLGLVFIGWIIDLLLIPDQWTANADRRLRGRPQRATTVSWVPLTFLGIFGVHRFYLGKWLTGLLWLLTGGLLLLGVLYDYWTLNGQVDEVNSGAS